VKSVAPTETRRTKRRVAIWDQFLIEKLIIIIIIIALVVMHFSAGIKERTLALHTFQLMLLMT